MPGSDPREVVFLYPYISDEVDAVARLARDLASMLESAGYSPRFLEMPRRSRLSRSRSRVVRRLGRSVNGVRNRLYLWRASWLVCARRRQVLAVIAVDVPIGVRAVGRFTRRLPGSRIKLVAWVMDLYWSPRKLQRELSPTQRRREERLCRRNVRDLRRSSDVVVLGSCMATLVREMTGQEATVVPLWARVDEAGEQTLRARLGIAPSTFVLLYAGNAGANHPLDALVDAVEGVSEDVVLVVAGAGERVEDLRRRSPAPSRVMIVARVPDEERAALYNTADVHVAVLDEAATGTCVPSKAYAAMAAAKPLLYLGDTEGQVALDLLRARAGRVAPTFDKVAVADAIRELLRDDLAQMGRRGRAFVEQHRSPLKGQERWLEFLGR